MPSRWQFRFNAQLHHCQGACTGLEDYDSYNLRVSKSICNLQYRSPNFFVIDQGRTKDERAIIKIANGCFVGFGYLSTDCTTMDSEFLHDCIKKYNDNRDIRMIIKGYLNRSKEIKIFEFNTKKDNKN
jgi:DNA polymerase-3 subunit epsilon